MPAPRRRAKFDARAFLDTAGVARRVVEYPAKAHIYQQGDTADTVIYLQSGRVKLSVVSAGGKEAVVGLLGPVISSGKAAWPVSPSAWARRPPCSPRPC